LTVAGWWLASTRQKVSKQKVAAAKNMRPDLAESKSSMERKKVAHKKRRGER
jgi:hypothetical protein